MCVLCFQAMSSAGSWISSIQGHLSRLQMFVSLDYGVPIVLLAAAIAVSYVYTYMYHVELESLRRLGKGRVCVCVCVWPVPLKKCSRSVYVCMYVYKCIHKLL